jgi:purine-binding chemotaxis protein CheW
MMTIPEESLSFKSPKTQQNLALFKLGRQIYALPVEVIVQIIPLVTIMPLPQAHAAVRGLINVRGTLTPVVSLSNLLGLPEPELRLHTPILLVKYRNYTLGTIVEDVVDVLAVTSREVESSDEILPETLQNNTALVALANTAKGTIFILDLARLLGDGLNEDLLEELETITTPAGEKAKAGGAPVSASANAAIPEKHSPPATELPLTNPPGKAIVKAGNKDRKIKSHIRESTPLSEGEGENLEPDPKLDTSAVTNEG